MSYRVNKNVSNNKSSASRPDSSVHRLDQYVLTFFVLFFPFLPFFGIILCQFWQFPRYVDQDENRNPVVSIPNLGTNLGATSNSSRTDRTDESDLIVKVKSTSIVDINTHSITDTVWVQCIFCIIHKKDTYSQDSFVFLIDFLVSLP